MVIGTTSIRKKLNNVLYKELRERLILEVIVIKIMKQNKGSLQRTMK